ncbi:MAG: TIGR02147 family protein [Proteobacteria bacterium]|nr:MAG: TIGR02147 family protein [Pseudomonadota bacterium]
MIILPESAGASILPIIVNQDIYFVDRLKGEYAKRNRANSRYSLRAYARDLEVNSSTLVQILNGKRSLPMKSMYSVMTTLGLSTEERAQFIESVMGSKWPEARGELRNRRSDIEIQESQFAILAEWEHFAFISYFALENIEGTVAGLADHFEISKVRVETVLKNLVQYGLVDQLESGEFRATVKNLSTTEDVMSAALRASHLETLEMGKSKLSEVEMELRDFSSLTLTLDPEHLDEIKAEIRAFRNRMDQLAEQYRKRSVYQLAIQLFPLSKKNLSRSRKL